VMMSHVDQTSTLKDRLKNYFSDEQKQIRRRERFARKVRRLCEKNKYEAATLLVIDQGAGQYQLHAIGRPGSKSLNFLNRSLDALTALPSRKVRRKK